MKTTLYWRKLLREAGVDASKVSSLTSDRKGWRKIVKERRSPSGVRKEQKQEMDRRAGGKE